MISSETIKYSIKNLLQRKSRSFLTILSIFVGITAIFVFISFGLGLYRYVDEVSSSSSAELILVQPRGGTVPGLDDTFSLNDDDLDAVDKAKGVFEASGVYFTTVEMTQENTRRYTFIIGYDPKVPLIMDSFNIDLAKGRMLESGDEGKVLLGYNYQIPDKIFPKGYDTGDRIEVNGKKLRIIGFLESVGNPQDDSQVYVTNGYIKELFDDESINYGMIVARVDTSDIEGVVENVEKELRKERGLEEGKEDFFVQSYEELLNTYMSVLDVIVGFIILIALISVLVSAVNTANTMITSVLERVKEIGVIKSVGARNSEIFKIFLFESSFLGFVSGLVGVIAGWFIAFVSGIILENLGWAFLSPFYPWQLFLGCIIFATVTGGISGFFPAYQASKLKPVDALRYE
ncbi:FtsX-like permease family protein [Candidatus Woesearchaeota archaeon]|nr:FtsX-like permease family protein [Candidatus Woesearchaeota archaeon]